MEMSAIEDMKVYDVVDLPRDRKPIGCKWVFDVKRDISGNIARYKVRLVAKGFSQVAGIYFQNIFSPVTKFETIRLLAGIVVERDLEVHHVDVKTAFLSSNLDEEIYMTPPWIPLELRDTFNAQTWNGKVWKLLNALYGLKQGFRAWNKTLNRLLQAIGFTNRRLTQVSTSDWMERIQRTY